MFLFTDRLIYVDIADVPLKIPAACKFLRSSPLVKRIVLSIEMCLMVQDEVTPTTVLSSSVYVVECSVLIEAVSFLKLASLKGNVKHFKRLNTMPFVFLCLFH